MTYLQRLITAAGLVVLGAMIVGAIGRHPLLPLVVLVTAGAVALLTHRRPA